MIIKVISKKYDDGADGFYFDDETNTLTVRTLQGCFEQQTVIPVDLVLKEPIPAMAMTTSELDDHPHATSIRKTFEKMLEDVQADLTNHLTEQHESTMDDLQLSLPIGWL